jgi:hypothetical protein
MSVDLIRFVTIAHRQGMPVRMINQVRGAFDFKTKKTGFNLVRGFVIELLEREVAVLQKAELGNQMATTMFGAPTNFIVSERDEVDTIYHECAHAFCDLKRGLKAEDMTGMTVANVFRRAADYYKGARLDNGRTVDRLDDVVHEVVGEYTAHRAATMWETIDRLYWLIRYGTPGDTQFRNYRSAYNTAMQKKLFGYEKYGREPKFKISRVKDRPIPDFLAAFCDRILLEDKIPHRFDASSRLIALEHQALKKITYGPPAPGADGTAR